MSFIPVALQILPTIPSLINNILSIVEAVRSDPATPDEAKAELEALSARLKEVVDRVKAIKFPDA